MRDSKPFLFSVLAFALAFALCSAAEARTGLAPVVAEGGLELKLAKKVQRSALRALSKRGVNPPAPATLQPKLGLANPTDPPTTAQCVDAGRSLGLDVIVVIRLLPSSSGAVEAEMRVVVVETGEERLYSARDNVARTPKQVAALVARVFENTRAWDTDLVDVERALGRDVDKLYGRFLADDDPQKGLFAQYTYDRAERRRNASAGFGVALPVLLAGATVWFGVGTRRIWDDPHENDDDEETDICFVCGIGDLLIGFARFMVVLGYVAGAALTVVSVAVPILIYQRRKREMSRLRPLLKGKSENEPISWHVAPWASPYGGGLALDLRF